jgi:hypothetical protein
MNANTVGPDISAVLVHARLYERLAERAVERHRASEGPGLRERLAGFIRALRQSIADPTDVVGGVVPSLIDYPHRG